jgi:hypothetical protein
VSPVLSCRICTVVLSLVVGLIGCGSRLPTDTAEGKNLRALAIFYGRFIGSHKGRSPANEAEFKKFILSLPAPEREALGVADPNNIDTLFTSPRDGQPYVIRYKQSSSGLVGGQATVFAYEKTGKNGKRYVATSVGNVEEVDEQRFKQLVPEGP